MLDFTVFVKQILAVAGTDQFIGRLFSGGSRSSSDFIVQDFAVIMIVAANNASYNLQVEATDGNRLHIGWNSNRTSYSPI